MWGEVRESVSNWEWEQQKQSATVRQANLAAHCDRQQMSSGPHGRADTGGNRDGKGGGIDEGRQQQHSQMSTTMLTS